MIAVPARRLHPQARLPAYATDEAAGADLHACLNAPLVLLPGQRILVPTGIAIALPKGFELQIRPRSGLALRHGITVLNTPGTIDSDYRGEIGVVLLNTSQEPFTVAPGDRIAQAVLARHETARFVDTDTLPPSTRGASGFGSTGRTEIPAVPISASNAPKGRLDCAAVTVLSTATALISILGLASTGLLSIWTGVAAAGLISVFLSALLLLRPKSACPR